MAKGTTITIAATAGTYLFSFVGRVAVARIFTNDHWGEFNIGIALVSLVATVALLGFQQSISRSVSYETDEREREAVIGWSVILSVVIGAAATTALFLLARPLAAAFNNVALVQVFQVLSFTVGFTIVATILAAVFRGFEDVTPNAIFVLVAQPLLFFILLFLSLAVGGGFFGLLLTYTLAWAAAAAGILVYTAIRLPRHIRHVRLSWRLPNKEFWTLSVSLWGVTSLAYVTAYFDTLILGLYWPAATVGYYSAAMVLARVFLLASGVTTFIFLPVVARLSREKHIPAIRNTFVASARWVTALAFPLFLLFVFDPTLSMRAVFGSDFLPAAPFLVTLAAAGFLAIVVGPVNATLAGFGYARVLLLTTGFSALLNVILSLALIPTYGAQGASVAWAVARGAYPALGLFALYRAHSISPFARSYLRPLLLASVIGAPVFVGLSFLHLPFWTVIPLYFAAAGLFLWAVVATRGADPSDLLIIESVERYLGRPLPRVRQLLQRAMVVP